PATLTPTNSIAFDSDVTIMGAGPRLHIGPNGTVIEKSAGVTIDDTTSPTQLSVDNIDTPASGAVKLAASGDASRTVTGTPHTHISPSVAAVLITNESSKSLLLHDINVRNLGNTTNLASLIQVDAGNRTGFRPTTDRTSAAATQVR